MTQQPDEVISTPNLVKENQIVAPPKRKFPWVVVLVLASIGLKVAKIEHRRDVQRQEAQQEQMQAAQTSVAAPKKK